MNVIKKNNDFIYTYKMKKGISKVKGAQKVLKDLFFPENIINAMN
jgi:DNA mismatch repair ATPase MutS